MSKKKHRNPARGADSGVATAVAELPTETHTRAEAGFAEVELHDAEDAEIDEQEARVMLTRAARWLNSVVSLSKRALKNVTPEQLEKLSQPEPDNNEIAPASDPRKRPRGRKHPVLVLMAIGNAAARHLKQILKVLHPELFNTKPEPEKVKTSAYTVARVMDQMKGRLEGLGLKPA